MHDELSKGRPAVRRRVVLFLVFLSSDKCRRACHPFLSPGELGFELCRLWMDEIYAPGIRYLDGLKGDRSPEEVRRFQDCFTDEERAALERFHHFLQLRIEMLPRPERRAGHFPQNDLWRNLVKDASHLLETLGADPQMLEHQLIWIIRALSGDENRALDG